MKVKRRSKIRDIFRVSLALYLFLTVFTAILTVRLYFGDLHSNQGVSGHWFYFSFCFGLPALLVLIGWLYILRDTKYRYGDPYRFALEQYRNFNISNFNANGLRTVLKSLDYKISSEKIGSSDFELLCVRGRPKNLDRFHEKRYPYWHTIKIQGVLNDQFWKVQFVGKPAGRFSLGDFRNIVYDSLEELIAELHWEQFRQS